MADHTVALFIHIVGALGLFLAIGIEWVTLGQLRRVRDAAGAQLLAPQLGLTRLVGVTSLIALLAAGLYMTLTRWGWQPWIVVSFTALVAILPPLGAFNGIRLTRALQRLEPSSGGLDGSIVGRLRDPRHVVSVRVRAAVVVAIVFLMTAKPDLATSIFGIGAGVVAGVAASLPAWTGQRRTAADAVPL